MPRGRSAALRAAAFRHAGIVVTNLDASLRFYRDLLGFRVWRRRHERGPYIDSVVGLRGAELKWVQLKAANGGVIELLQYLSHPLKAPKRVRSNEIGASHVAMTVRDIDSLYLQLIARGYRVNNPPRLAPNGRVKVAYAHDPDGTIVELVEEVA